MRPRVKDCKAFFPKCFDKNSVRDIAHAIFCLLQDRQAYGREFWGICLLHKMNKYGRIYVESMKQGRRYGGF